jgi:hypothetical protein
VDSSGAKSNAANINLRVSNEEPIAAFLSPASGSTQAGKFTLKGSALPSSTGTASISKICLKINGKTSTTGTYRGYSISGNSDSDGCISSYATDPYWDFDATEWANGTYTFSFYAIDSSGRSTKPVSQTLVIANENPMVFFTNPADGAALAGKFTLKASAVPSSGGTASVSKVCLKVNGKVSNSGTYRGYSISGNSDADGCISSYATDPYWDFDATDWVNGTYQFIYFVVDSSGRTSNTAFKTITILNANPTVSFTTPAEGASTSGRVTLSGIATPSDQGTASVSKICLRVNGSVATSGTYRGYSISGNSNLEGCISSYATDPYWDFDFSVWAPGNYTFSFYAVDSSGRQSNTVTRTLRKP